MATRKKNLSKGNQVPEQPKTLAIAARGVTTGQDFAHLMSTLMTDLISGSISPGIGNAVCNAGGKLLKIVEMQHKYGTLQQSDGSRILLLTGPQQIAYPSEKAKEAPQA